MKNEKTCQPNDMLFPGTLGQGQSLTFGISNMKHFIANELN